MIKDRKDRNDPELVRKYYKTITGKDWWVKLENNNELVPSKEYQRWLEHNMLEKMNNTFATKDEVDPFGLKRGGRWLAEVRSYIQNNFINGSDVTWGSTDVLKPYTNVKQLEEMAYDVSVATLKEFTERTTGSLS